MSLSDLDLVQQAMAPTEPGAQNGSSNTAAPSSNESPNPAPETKDDPLADIDLSTLSDGDRAALQPILDALKSASGKDGEEGGDVDVEGILKQLEAADGVAGTLESRLDKLLDNLGAMERDAEQECEEAEKAKATSGQEAETAKAT